MILTNTDTYPGKQYNILGIVKGSTVQSRHVGKDILSGLKTLIGGELTNYTEMMNDARAQATKRLVAEAEAMDADAVINLRYTSSAVMSGASEILAYGTAIKFT